DLDDDAVDLVVELRAPRLPPSTRFRDVLDRLEPLRERVDREAVTAQPLERLPVRAEGEPVGRTDAVRPERERPRRRDRRVLLPQRAGRGVPRVRSRLLALGD